MEICKCERRRSPIVLKVNSRISLEKNLLIALKLILVKTYQVDVYTGDKFGCGTDANVYCTIFGDKGDTGKRQLERSETHTNKFERKQLDRFRVQSADLGNIFKMIIGHDNSGLGADWLLDRVEVIDDIRTFVFHCEQWLAKGKGDSKLERILYEKVNLPNAVTNDRILLFRTIKVHEVAWDLSLVRLVGPLPVYRWARTIAKATCFVRTLGKARCPLSLKNLETPEKKAFHTQWKWKQAKLQMRAHPPTSTFGWLVTKVDRQRWCPWNWCNEIVSNPVAWKPSPCKSPISAISKW